MVSRSLAAAALHPSEETTHGTANADAPPARNRRLDIVFMMLDSQLPIA